MTWLTWPLVGAIIWFAGLALWIAIRWVPNRRARRAKITVHSRKPIERFSMIVSWMGLGGFPLIWIATGWPSALDHATHPLIILIGTVIFIVSLRLFRLTHKALGAMWSHSLDLRENHKLVSHGIYERVRHPMYTAFWLWALAQPFLLSNWLAGLSGIVGFGTLYFLRIGQEERMMEERFGEQYRDYCKRTKRIIPGIY
ncbi:MAG: isoprenylcysteine carboxylmethyltransferase family protein [Salaquimonas sp.]|jgi:protein-S-isoprenylcysteine O-methyltransferase Ste14|nr:isoprenylcysteine carboxylmethyltransferase family protein [Salaquimonas sp.]